MTKKHFKAIAEILRLHNNRTDDQGATSYLAYDLIEFFESINPNFDKDKFIQATHIKNVK